MDNPEEVLHCLDEFAKVKPKDIPRELEDYLMYVARTGDPVYQWPVVKCLFREKLLSVITEFYETTPTLDLPQSPNVDPFNYESMKAVLLERLEAFSNAPFTVQRLCELLTTPRKEYNRPDKFMRAIEKNILVVSTREPGSACRPDSALSEPLPNGISESVEPPVNPTSNEGNLTEESRSAASKDIIGNHVNLVSSDQPNQADQEQSGPSSQENESHDVTVDVETKDTSKKEESVTDTASIPALQPTESSLASSEESEKVLKENTSVSSCESSSSDGQTEHVTAANLSSTSTDHEVKPEDSSVKASVATSDETITSENSDTSQSLPTDVLETEAKPEVCAVESSEPSTPKTSDKSSIEPEKDSKSIVSEPGIIEQLPQPTRPEEDLEKTPKTLEDSKPVLVEEVLSDASPNVVVDIPTVNIPAVDVSKLQEKSKKESGRSKLSIGTAESDSEAVISDSTEENVEAESSGPVSEEVVSVNQALDEAMDVDESSNHLADTEAMAVAEEGEPMDESDQSPTEEMTVCPQLPSQEQ